MNQQQSDMIEKLRAHLNNTPIEELRKNWEEIKAMGLGGPTCEEFFRPHPQNISHFFYDFDKRGVRAFVKYQPLNGGWKIECWRKMTDKESQEFQAKNNISDGGVWQMIHEGQIISYQSRQEAELKALEMAQQICEEYNF